MNTELKHTSLIEWFEIVTQDLERAIKFYESAFNIKTEKSIHLVYSFGMINGQWLVGVYCVMIFDIFA